MAILAVILSQLAYMPINKVVLKYNCHSYKRLTEIYEDTTAYDLIFIGSSRTHRSIYPKIIDSICGLNSYNAGTEAGTIEDFKLTLKGYLVHHPAPKVVVLTIDLPTFSRHNEIHNYPQYYPFLNNPVVNTTLSDDGYNIGMVKAMPFVTLTDLDDYSRENTLRLAMGKGGTDIPDGDFEYKGFLSNTTEYIVKPQLEKDMKRMVLYSECMASLNEMIDICKQHNIKVIFTYAPEYDFNLQKTRTNTDSVFNFIYSTVHKNNIPYLRDDSLDLCKDPRLFANNGHLNKPGAIVYSAVLAEELNNILVQKSDSLR